MTSREPEAAELVKRLRDQEFPHSIALREGSADLIESLTRELAEANEAVEQAENDKDEADVWPGWAEQMLKLLKKHGYEFDEIDGVDLPQDMADWLEGYKDSAERERDAMASRATTAEQALTAARKALAEIAEIANVTGPSKLECLDRLASIAVLAATPITAGQGDGE